MSGEASVMALLHSGSIEWHRLPREALADAADEDAREASWPRRHLSWHYPPSSLRPTVPDHRNFASRLHVSYVVVQPAGSFLPAPESPEDRETERREHEDNSDVCYQPLQGVVPEEQDVHADHDAYHREHVQHDGYLSSHGFVLQGVTEWGKSDSQARHTSATWR
jgi:hypothetical protein